MKNAPHSLDCLLEDKWDHCYTREVAGFPLEWIRERGKVWPSVARIDGIKGDRNLKVDFDWII